MENNNKVIQARIEHKHATHSQWAQGEMQNYIPGPGEIAIYDAEGNKGDRDNPYLPANIKCGNGKTAIKDLPFVGGADIIIPGEGEDSAV